MKTVNKLDYLYRTLVVKAREQRNKTVDITDEEYVKYYDEELEPVEPIPGSDIPIPGEEDPDHDYSQDYLTFEALEDGTFSFTINDLYYSTNNGASWKSLAAGTETELITKGTKVLWKKDSSISNPYINASTHWNTDPRIGIGTFSSTNKFNVSGNIYSLALNDFIECTLNTSSDIYKNYFMSLFENCKYLISANNLIIPNQDISYSTLGYGSHCENIYSYMFKGCTNLIYPPKKLPLILCGGCFSHMFEDCINLIKAPEILTTDSISGSCECIFKNCASLKYIKCLTINGVGGYEWVLGVSQSGMFIKNSEATWNISTSGIPAGWEIIDEEVPEE